MDFLIDPYRRRRAAVVLMTLTSLPYPILSVEGLASSASLPSLQIVGQPVERIAVGATLEAAALTVVLRYGAIDADTERLASACQIEAGTLIRVLGYRNANGDTERLASAGEITAGTLIRINGYIDLICSPESLNSSAALIGATLT